MIDSTVQPVLVALATVCTAIMIGLGFLPRPSRQGAIWSAALICLLAAGYFTVSADAAAAALPALSGGAAGLAVAGLALVWVGVRVHRGRRLVLLVPTLIGAGVLTVVLMLTAGGPWMPVAAAAALAVAAFVLAATTVELLGVGGGGRFTALPLAIASGLGSAFTAVWLIGGTVRRPAPAFDGAHEYVAVLAAAYLGAAVVSLVLLCRGEGPRRAAAPAVDFAAVAQERLARAAAAGDTWWSLLDVRLDDPAALREASSTLAYTRVLERFAADVTGVFPAEADIERIEATRFLILLPRHEPAVRPIIRTLLQRVATVAADQSIAVRLSASIGWAGVEAVGFGLEALTAAASAAADEAQRAGGDRWERAEVTV